MEKIVDILVIGGGPAGTVSATTARKYYPDKKIILIKHIADGCIPCGIPYMFSSLKNPDDNRLGITLLEKDNTDVMIDETTKVNRSQKSKIWFILGILLRRLKMREMSL